MARGRRFSVMTVETLIADRERRGVGTSTLELTKVAL